MRSMGVLGPVIALAVGVGTATAANDPPPGADQLLGQMAGATQGAPAAGTAGQTASNASLPVGISGLSGFEKWLSVFANAKSKDGWLKALGRGDPLFDALKSIYFWVETSGTGGGLYRSMQADFLDEAAPVVKSKSLPGLAERYRQLATRWTDFAEAALPDDVLLFRETKEWLIAMQRLFDTDEVLLDSLAKLREL